MQTIPIIDKLGGRAAVAEGLKRTHTGRSSVVTPKAIGMWVSRGAIPGYAVIQLMTLAKEKRLAVSASDFERTAKPKKSKKKEKVA